MTKAKLKITGPFRDRFCRRRRRTAAPARRPSAGPSGAARVRACLVDHWGQPPGQPAAPTSSWRRRSCCRAHESPAPPPAGLERRASPPWRSRRAQRRRPEDRSARFGDPRRRPPSAAAAPRQMPALRPRLGAPSCAVPLSYAIEPRPQSPRGSIRAAATAPGDSRPAAEDLGAWVGRCGGKDGWQAVGPWHRPRSQWPRKGSYI